MIEIVLEVSNSSGAKTLTSPHFSYLTKDDLVNLLLNFNSAAFTTPFRLEESLISYQNRIFAVSDLLANQIQDIHPDYKRHIIEIFSLLKALKKLSQNFKEYTYYIPWQTGFPSD